MNFYVYRLFHQGETLYVGKGSGTRLQTQKRRFRLDGEVIERFDDEGSAYEAERRYIAKMQPVLNRNAGGFGGWSGAVAQRSFPRGFTAEGLVAAAPFLARLLLRFKADPSLSGILGMVGAYIDAHGIERLSAAVTPHIKRFAHNYLPTENSA